MNKPNRLNEVYSTWFLTSVTQSLSEQENQTGQEQSVLFVTITFKRSIRPKGEPPGQAELDAFSHVYNRVCRATIGRNFNRPSKQSLLPRVLAFIDAEGSRFWRTGGDLTNLHIHSIWTVPRAESKRIEATISGQVGIPGDMVIDAIDIQEIERTASRSLRTICSYSSKLIGFNNSKLVIGEDFRSYPVAPKCRRI